MIKRSTLRAQVAGALRDEILAGRLPAGSHFTVKEIAEQYGVSATPVREALVDLAAQGLLDVEQHRGFRVHEFTIDDYRSMVKARMVVLDGLFHGYFSEEGPVPVLALDAAVLASVRRRAEAAVRAAHAGDLDVLIGYDLRYWRELSEVIGNRYICDFLDRLRVQCWVYSVPFLRKEHEMAKRLWSGHRVLVDAVEREDAQATRQIMDGYHRHSLALAE
ncbi:GntR family transcriptional regulator [Streptomyces abyssalis]|uniref:GntR family transcriptional regulator n=1 Tax=Streptomyces abyssalis TaxID=933944 RepID=A0A1E7JP86_9ACTN|nr:GntR family transcriptional regulator [Streptomyces abyssalis]OEU86532.1 GntR family transcriptional regulator [Streptomyces abyssalis]OEU90078.1 GntR family transcriptional regulator [Streptomyces abyssalis]OEV30880.1 GntR family transcriptional regulator [Streptomyces nanshensis]